MSLTAKESNDWFSSFFKVEAATSSKTLFLFTVLWSEWSFSNFVCYPFHFLWCEWWFEMPWSWGYLLYSITMNIIEWSSFLHCDSITLSILYDTSNNLLGSYFDVKPTTLHKGNKQRSLLQTLVLSNFYQHITLKYQTFFYVVYSICIYFCLYTNMSQCKKIW